MMNQAFKAWEDIIVKRAYLENKSVSRRKIKILLDRLLSQSPTAR